jgi:hypothetical protein
LEWLRVLRGHGRQPWDDDGQNLAEIPGRGALIGFNFGIGRAFGARIRLYNRSAGYLSDSLAISDLRQTQR